MDGVKRLRGYLKKILKPIRKKFNALADPSYIEGVHKVTGSEDRILGVRVPEIKSIAYEYFKANGNTYSIGDLLSLADECFKSESREEQLFAVFIISKRVNRMERKTWRLVDNLVD